MVALFGLILSIHAPTRGATSICSIFSAIYCLSIHAPTRGATVCPSHNHNNSDSFNPRSYKRSDNILGFYSSISGTFNPRSYKRSDFIINPRCTIAVSFNPRSYKRSDALSLRLQKAVFVFQSTLLQEERPAPRLPSRRTPHLSIHAPTRGATIYFRVL